MEKSLSEQESFQIIQQMIENSKAKFKDNSFFFILWGWLVLLSSVTDFILGSMHLYYSFLIWPVVMSLGAIASAIKGYQFSRVAKVKTVYDTVMAYLWVSFFICGVLIGTLAYTGIIQFIYIPVLFMLISGLATIVTGGMLKFKPFVLGGISCWLILIICILIPDRYIVLLSALSVITAYIIPGYMLKSKVTKHV